MDLPTFSLCAIFNSVVNLINIYLKKSVTSHFSYSTSGIMKSFRFFFYASLTTTMLFYACNLFMKFPQPSKLLPLQTLILPR